MLASSFNHRLGEAMNPMQPTKDNNPYKEKMYTVIAELFEKTGANNPDYSETQKATDILEVLSTLMAFTIYNSCPNSETIRDSCEAAYFHVKQMALAYHYQIQKQNEQEPGQVPAGRPENNASQPVMNRSQFGARKF